MDRAALERQVAELVAEYGSPCAYPSELLCDRHPAHAVAFTVVEPDLSYRELTFGELRNLSERFAAQLASRGIGPGDAVATLTAKSAGLVVALLGSGVGALSTCRARNSRPSESARSGG